MGDVFISRASTDETLARRLDTALSGLGRSVAATVDDADALVFLLSPDACVDDRCLAELMRATTLERRLVPVVAREPGDGVPARLAALNWLFFRPDDDFDVGVGSLVDALDTDLGWVRAHARLLARAADWEGKDDRNLLLRGRELEEAEGWLAAQKRNPDPTPVEGRYVLASRRSSTQRQRGYITSSVAIGMVVLILASLSFVLRAQASDREHLATSRGLAAASVEQRVSDPQLAVILALRAWNVKHTPEAEAAMRDAVVRNHEVGTLRSHDGLIFHVAFSRDGKTLASTGDDGKIRLWNAISHKVIRTIPTHQSKSSSVEFSPTDRVIAASGADGTVRTWDPSSGRSVRVMRGHEGSVNALAFSKEGLLASGGSDGAVRLWDTDTGKQLSAFRHGAYVSSVSFSTDGSTIASAGLDGIVNLWTATGSADVRSRYAEVKAVAMSPDGDHLAIAPSWPVIDIYNRRLRLARSIKDRASPETVVYDATGRRLASAGDDPRIFVDGVQAAGRGSSTTLRGHHGRIWNVAFSRDGRTLASAGSDGTLRLWDVDPSDDAAFASRVKGASSDELAKLADDARTRDLTDAEEALYIEGKGVAGAAGG